MGHPVSWVLNLDAEEELAAKGRWSRRDAVARRIAELVPELSGLIGPGDAIVGRDHAGPTIGRAWCPTPSALAELRRAGIEPPRAPAVDVLRRVNHRRFSAELGPTLPGAGFVERAIEERLSQVEPGSRWLLKRPFGFAGRNRRRVVAQALSAADRDWIRASAGLQVEPWVTREIDAALHGYLFEDGRRVFGVPCIQRCAERGDWISSARATSELTAEEITALQSEIERAAEQLFAAGYFGAFGIDGFRWRDDQGELHFRARSEINARYTMGWAIGIGEFRPPPGAP